MQVLVGVMLPRVPHDIQALEPGIAQLTRVRLDNGQNLELELFIRVGRHMGMWTNCSC